MTPKNNSAQIARQAEEDRQARIRAGAGEIDRVFGAFNDDYFGGVQQSYSDFYMPQAEDQYERARKQLMLTLAKSGNINSSAGAVQLGDLSKKYSEAQATIGNQARAAANQARSNVESNRSDLYASLAADPVGASKSAVNRFNALSEKPVYSPLADLFGTIGNSAANAFSQEREGQRGWGTGLFSQPKNGSQKINWS